MSAPQQCPAVAERDKRRQAEDDLRHMVESHIVARFISTRTVANTYYFARLDDLAGALHRWGRDTGHRGNILVVNPDRLAEILAEQGFIVCSVDNMPTVVLGLRLQLQWEPVAHPRPTTAGNDSPPPLRLYWLGLQIALLLALVGVLIAGLLS